MPCGCNSICDNDCASNQLCTGHVPVCSNDFTFTNTIVIGTIVKAEDLLELQAAIDAERNNSGRRYNASDPAYCTTHTPGDVACSNNDFSSYSWSASAAVNGVVDVNHYDEVKSANNEVVNNSGYGQLVTTNFVSQSADVSVGKTDSIVKADHINELKTRINQTRNACICDSHCNCDPSDCGCNGECPSDDPYYS